MKPAKLQFLGKKTKIGRFHSAPAAVLLKYILKTEMSPAMAGDIQ
jgi:hypothetical protein